MHGDRFNEFALAPVTPGQGSAKARREHNCIGIFARSAATRGTVFLQKGIERGEEYDVARQVNAHSGGFSGLVRNRNRHRVTATLPGFFNFPDLLRCRDFIGIRKRAGNIRKASNLRHFQRR